VARGENASAFERSSVRSARRPESPLHVDSHRRRTYDGAMTLESVALVEAFGAAIQRMGSLSRSLWRDYVQITLARSAAARTVEPSTTVKSSEMADEGSAT
jgi:hypothetical protein